MIKGKIFMEYKKIDNGTTLDQLIKTDTLDIDLLEKLGGCTFIDGYYQYNEAGYKKLMIYDNNKIRLILPPDVLAINITRIIKRLDLIGINQCKMYETLGYWINKDNKVDKELNTILEFNIELNNIQLDEILRYMRFIKNQYEQESTAFYVNDSLILV